MVLPPSWYIDAGDVLNETVGEHTQSMQTSLIPYTPKWADLIHRRFGGWIGSSFDFSGLRTLSSGRVSYEDLWMSKVEQARHDGITVIPSIVPTASDIYRASEIVDWFCDHGFTDFNIERYNEFDGPKTSCPSNKEHSQFLIRIFDSVMKRVTTTGKAPVVNTVSAAVRGVLYGVPGDRWGGTCQSDFVVIEPDGSTNTCPDRASHQSPFSNVRDGADSFLRSNDRRKWIRLQQIGHRNDFCSSCRFSDWCRSGCPLTKNDHQESGDCSGYSIYLNHVLEFCESSPAVVEQYLDISQKR